MTQPRAHPRSKPLPANRAAASRRPLRVALACGLLLATLSPVAHAAMNFCAAPALQNNEDKRPDAAVAALLQRVRQRAGGPNAASGAAALAGAARYTSLAPDAAPALAELTLMRDAALSWRVTRANDDLRLAENLLLAWSRDYQLRFDPEAEAPLARLILAYDLSASALPVSTRNAAIAFLTRLADGYIAQVPPGAAPAATVAGDQRAKLVAMAAFALDSRNPIRAADRLYFAQIATTTSLADGDLETALDRLQPLVTAALAARRHQLDWLRRKAPNGASLQAALDALMPAVRAHAAGGAPVTPVAPANPPSDEPVSGGDALDREAAIVYQLAARLDPRYRELANTLASAPPAWLAVCLPLTAR